jgi:hypothetical protein
MREKTIKRKCLVCGKKLSIKVKENGAYNKGHYFGKMKFPVGKGKYKKVGRTRMLGKMSDVVKWIGKEKEIEYWECGKCFNED